MVDFCIVVKKLIRGKSLWRGNAGKSVHFELTNEKWLVINSYFPTSFNFVLQVLLVDDHGFEPAVSSNAKVATATGIPPDYFVTWKI